MYEVFLTAIIDKNDFAMARRILSGYCKARPVRGLCRVIYYQGPEIPAGLSRKANIDREAIKKDPENQQLWDYVDIAFKQQSFIVTARYDVKPEDFGPNAPEMDCNAREGILRFSDLPEPPSADKPMLLHRKVAELWGQRNLIAVLEDNMHTYKNEQIHETCTFYRDDLEIQFHRSYLPRERDEMLPIEQMPIRYELLRKLPALDELNELDPFARWQMYAKIHVDENRPETLASAQAKLERFRKDLEGVIPFETFPRWTFDGRAWLGDKVCRAPKR